MLPSQQLRDLAKTFDICLSGKKSPANCDVRYRQLYWLMVFDQEGELRSACKLGEQLGVEYQYLILDTWQPLEPAGSQPDPGIEVTYQKVIMYVNYKVFGMII